MTQTPSKKVRIYVVEEQEICRGLYKLVFPVAAPIELVGVSTGGDISSRRQEISTLDPDVLLLGVKELKRNIIEELEQIRRDDTKLGLVLVLAFYDAENIELLTELAIAGKGGMAIFLKQYFAQVEQLWGIILAISQGDIIIDPALISSLPEDKLEYQLLKQLSARKLENLGLL